MAGPNLDKYMRTPVSFSRYQLLSDGLGRRVSAVASPAIEEQIRRFRPAYVSGELVEEWSRRRGRRRFERHTLCTRVIGMVRSGLKPQG
jgi:hypothetical protein